jgi:hypothetical protein
MTPTAMPQHRSPGVGQRRSPRRKNTCARDGCDHRIGRRQIYCCAICEGLGTQFSRLQALYETAGDPTLSREAWLALVELNDQWTEFVGAMAALFKEHS